MASISLKDTQGKALGADNTFLVDQLKNGLFTYHGSSIPQFKFNPSSKNMLWTVVENRFFILRNVEFDQIKNNKTIDIRMIEVKQEFKNVDELKVFLGI